MITMFHFVQCDQKQFSFFKVFLEEITYFMFQATSQGIQATPEEANEGSCQESGLGLGHPRARPRQERLLF